MIHRLLEAIESTNIEDVRIKANSNITPKKVSEVFSIGSDGYDLASESEAIDYLNYDLKVDELKSLNLLKRLGAVKGYTLDFIDDSKSKHDVPQAYVVKAIKNGLVAAELYTRAQIDTYLIHDVVLDFENYKNPRITMEGKTLVFKTMRDGHAYQIIDHCLQKFPSKEVGLDTLKKELNLSGVSNISETLRKTAFEKNGLLKDFVSSFPKHIIVHKKVRMSVANFKKISVALTLSQL